MTPSLIALPVMIPLLAAALSFLVRNREKLQTAIAVVALTIVLVVSIGLLVHTALHGEMALMIGGWAPQLGIVLVLDRLSALMLTVSSAVTLCVLIYASAQSISAPHKESPLAVFHPTYLVLVAGVSDAFLAGDLFNLYVAFEILLSASYVLLTLGATRARIRAGISYVIVSVIGSMLFLAAIVLAYLAAGTVNLAELALRLESVDSTARLTIELLLLLAFGLKAAIFPLSSWLPDSYPTAPAPVTAVFAGLLTKVGIYSIVRLETLLFPHSDVSELVLVAAGLTMIVGILGAVAQSDLKRVLSFTLVSHMGYMLMGIGLGTQLGLTAAVFYIAHHITVQTVLFLVAGLVEERAGTTDLKGLGGLAALSPLLAILFFVPAMNLAGIPPLSGFLGKLGLMEAGIAVGTPLAWMVVAAGMLTSLLTLYAIAKIWNRAFWQSAPAEVTANVRARRVPRAMTGATALLLGLNLALTVLAGPLTQYASDAATDMQERTPYLQIVLGGGGADQLDQAPTGGEDAG